MQTEVELENIVKKARIKRNQQFEINLYFILIALQTLRVHDEDW